MQTSETECLPLAHWQDLASRHRIEVKKWTDPYRRRKAAHQEHPVFDFLFTYYPFSLGRLEQWHPGFGHSIACENGCPQRFQSRHYQQQDGIISLNPSSLSSKEITRLKWIHNLLSLTQKRTPHFACYGLHEWAMVYQGQSVRHKNSTPLRLPQDQIDHLVESRSITCSHFDAYRFFSPAAISYNKLKPTLDLREDFEQCGCLHTNMDLYKWASKCMPWVGSDLLWKCFKLALKARELDMRASPYDLSTHGYEPISIETREGRAEYEARQREISHSATPLRQHLIKLLAEVIHETGSHG